VRLLTRTTRKVAPTEAGERLAATIGPRMDEIEAELAALAELRTRPAGTIRITSGAHAAETILWPALAKLLPDYPEVHVEVSLDSGLADIVAERFDAGVRLGEQVARDMIAMPLGPELRMACVGAPRYFARAPKPETPQDLAGHVCINLRFATSGGLYAWEFEKEGRTVNVRVEGQLVFNDPRMIRRAALAGFGLAFLPEDQVLGDIGEGRLARVLEEWTPPFPGYHLYYPSRRQHLPAFALLLDALRYPRQ
jgi:DNA-binding transcriptional LysR family regulator